MTTKRLIRISYFTMLTVIGAMIRIPVPPVSFTLQTLMVILAGFVLGKYDGAFAQIAYMVLGLVGVPIFTQGGGFSYVFEPSFGYIFAFWIGAFVAGWAMYNRKKITSMRIFLCGVAGLLPIYLIGMSYQVIVLALYTGMGWAAAIATLPGILIMFVGDCVMLFLLSLIYPRVKTLMKIHDNVKTTDSAEEPAPSADSTVRAATEDSVCKAETAAASDRTAEQDKLPPLPEPKKRARGNGKA